VKLKTFMRKSGKQILRFWGKIRVFLSLRNTKATIITISTIIPTRRETKTLAAELVQEQVKASHHVYCGTTY
jgi:hypothetical protein